MSLPKTVKAVVVQEVGIQSSGLYHGDLTLELVQNGTNVLQEVPIQTLGENEILVRVKAVAINPTDWKRLSLSVPICAKSSPKPHPLVTKDAKWFTQPGSYIGCDFAGEVVQVGPNLKTGIKVGDKVASSVRGGVSRERGAFSEYAKTFADLAFVIPEGTWSFEEASTIGIPLVSNDQHRRLLTSARLVCIPPFRPCTARRPWAFPNPGTKLHPSMDGSLSTEDRPRLASTRSNSRSFLVTRWPLWRLRTTLNL